MELSKLNYIKSLRGECPEGYEIARYFNGGCVKCRQQAKNGLQLSKSNIKQRIHENDTVHTNRGIYNLSDKKLPYKKMSTKDYQKLSINDKIKADRKDLASGRASEDPSMNKKKKRCGGSIKKRF